MIILKYLKTLDFKKVMILLSMLCVAISASLYHFYDQTISDVPLDHEFLKDQLGEKYFTEWPEISYQVDLSDTQKKQLDSILSKMSLEQKIGQMIRLSSEYDPAELIDLHIGSIELPRDVGANNRTRQSQLLSTHDELYESIMQKTQELKLPFIPPFICIAENIGNHRDSRAVMFPVPPALGAANDLQLTYQLGDAVAKQFKSTGINCVKNTLALTQFSEHPLKSIEHLQSYYSGFLSNNRLLSSVNLNAFEKDSFNKDNNYQNHNFVHALNVGVLSIELNNIEDENLESIAILKQKMKFSGVVVSAPNAANNLKGCWVGKCAKLINAGVDIVVLNTDSQFLVDSTMNRTDVFIENTIHSINSGEIKLSRIDDAVKRILSVKFSMGLFDGLLPSDVSDQMQDYKEMVENHEVLANKIVKQSAVLIKNENNLIPMQRKGNYLIAGDALDTISYQMDFMNNKNANKFERAFKDYTQDATIIDPLFLNEFRVVDSLMNQHYNSKMKVNRELRLSPIKMELVVPEKEQLKIDEYNEKYDEDERYQFSGTQYDYYLELYREKIREYVSGFDRIIYIMNEQNFRALSGLEIFNLGAPITQSNLLEVIEDVDIEIVVIYMSEVPESIPVALNQSDAFVMAWKPGSELNGLMDLIFENEQGEVVSDFSGKLSKTWPMRSCDFKNFVGSQSVFSYLPFDFGLSIHDKQSNWIDFEEDLNFCVFRR